MNRFAGEPLAGFIVTMDRSICQMPNATAKPLPTSRYCIRLPSRRSNRPIPISQQRSCEQIRAVQRRNCGWVAV